MTKRGERMSLSEVFVSEVFGTGMLTLLGVGVVANVLLGKTKGKGIGGNWMLISMGWGLAVMAGVFAAYKSGAHLNPAVTFGIMSSGADTYGGAADVDVDVASTLVYLAGELTGAFIGAVLAWAAYKQHYDDPEADSATKLGTFSTGPEIRNYGWNLITEIIATFVLVYIILSLTAGGSPAELGGLYVALLVVAIGASLGGPTGYAINPARDLGPRVAHFVLPFRGKGHSDWAYSWVPIVGPIVGGVIAGLVSQVTF